MTLQSSYHTNCYVCVYIYIPTILEVISAELYCYSCTSAQSGCGDPIDVRLMHWKKCSGRQLIENYCVKLIQKVEDQTVVTRGCLSDLLLNTQYRLDMPQLRRHGYCVNSRDYQQYLLGKLKGQTLAETAMGLFRDANMNFKRFCYCNDWNGCNHVGGIKVRMALILSMTGLTMILCTKL
ncbi:unnamed protein product [Heterobilharzia americana]|nr:unnamed protein product [Heterobilharzia americana]CAH8534984.1 unnamed protein product [Heterobilharzia americana]